MTYSPIQIANYFIEKGLAEGVAISPMKLQKLVYYAEGWCLGLTGKPLINEEVKAWDYGPVIESVYHEFKHFGRNPITKKAVSYNVDGNGVHEYEPNIKDERGVKALLDRIWEIYKGFSATELSNLTHENGSPWSQVYPDNGRGAIISKERIRQYFMQRAKR